MNLEEIKKGLDEVPESWRGVSQYKDMVWLIAEIERLREEIQLITLPHGEREKALRIRAEKLEAENQRLQAEIQVLKDDNSFLNGRVRQLTDFDYAAEHCLLARQIRDLGAENQRLTERVRELREILVQAVVILEALHASVRWELAEDIRAEIANKLPLIWQVLQTKEE